MRLGILLVLAILVVLFICYSMCAIAETVYVGGLDVSADREYTHISDTSKICFDAGAHSWQIGRLRLNVTPEIKIDGSKRVASSYSKNGNTIEYIGSDFKIEYKLYDTLLKESVTLWRPGTVSYTYDLRLIDWTIDEPIFDENGKITEYEQHTAFAKDSTVEILPREDELVVYINSVETVVLPKPYAIDANGRRYEMSFELDTVKKRITINGDLTGAVYPVVVDPTERVTNGGYETGDLNGWGQSEGSWSYISSYEGLQHSGTYSACIPPGCDVFQTMNLTGVNTLTFWYRETDWWGYGDRYYHYVYIDGNYVWGAEFGYKPSVQWVQASINVSGWTESHTVRIYTYVEWTGGSHSYTCGFVDDVSALATSPPVAQYTASPLAVYAGQNVHFNDQSTGNPTSWQWSWGDGTANGTTQNPTHTYTNTGSTNITRTVILTASNAGGSDSEVKTNYIIVMPAPLSHNYDFIYHDISTVPTAFNARDDQYTIGYDAKNITNSNAQNAYNNMTNDAIFMFNGHGFKNNSSNYGGYIIFYNDTSIRSDNLIYRDLHRMLLAVYLSCYSGIDNPSHPDWGNFVNNSISQGATTAIGFREEIEATRSDSWSNHFWDRLEDDETVQDAANHAINDARSEVFVWPWINDGLDSMIIGGNNSTTLRPVRYGV